MKTLYKALIVTGLSALLAACANPSARSVGTTAGLADMAKFEQAPRERDCRLLVRGKANWRQCEL